MERVEKAAQVLNRSAFLTSLVSLVRAGIASMEPAVLERAEAELDCRASATRR